MWGAYVGLMVVTRLGLPFWAAIPVAMVSAGLLAVLLDLLAFKPLRALTYGGLILWGAFLVLLLGVAGPWDQTPKVVIAGLGAVGMLAGIVLDYRAITPIRVQQPPSLAPMISSIGASIILVSLAQGTFGSQVSRFPPTTF